MSKKGFTLIELMVVIAIIALLSAAVVPQVSKAMDRARVSRTAADLRNIANAMDLYLSDTGSYPPAVWDFGRPWGADVGLVEQSAVIPSHLSAWAGPYLKQWPTKTAWGGTVGCAATGAYYAHGPTGWINRDGIASNDQWIHMNPYCVRYSPGLAIEIDKSLDDGVPSTGNMRLTGGWPEYIYFYVGEGSRNW